MNAPIPLAGDSAGGHAPLPQPPRTEARLSIQDARSPWRELCRIPWSSIHDIFGGSEDETHGRLSGTDAPPSLILAQSDHLRADGRHHYIPSYTVIDWTDGASQRRQAVFELRGPRMGALEAQHLNLLKSMAARRA